MVYSTTKTVTHIEVATNNSYNFEWPFHQAMSGGTSLTDLMEPMDYVAMLHQLPGTDFHGVSCHSNIRTQE